MENRKRRPSTGLRGGGKRHGPPKICHWTRRLPSPLSTRNRTRTRLKFSPPTPTGKNGTPIIGEPRNEDDSEGEGHPEVEFIPKGKGKGPHLDPLDHKEMVGVEEVDYEPDSKPCRDK